MISCKHQLIRINKYTNEILDLVMAWGRNETIEVSKFKHKDPREIALRACAEIRNQIKLQLEIFQALYSLQEVEEFQKTILETLAEVSPKMRAEFVRKLKAKPSVRRALKFS